MSNELAKLIVTETKKVLIAQKSVAVAEPRPVGSGCETQPEPCSDYRGLDDRIRSLPPPHAGCLRGDPGPLPVLQ
jgi:hypothetical protein